MSARTIKKTAEMISARTSKFRMVGRKVPISNPTAISAHNVRTITNGHDRGKQDLTGGRGFDPFDIAQD